MLIIVKRILLIIVKRKRCSKDNSVAPWEHSCHTDRGLAHLSVLPQVFTGAADVYSFGGAAHRFDNFLLLCT